jgi:isoquinoline 1-oxidoreductase beta subunit
MHLLKAQDVPAVMRLLSDERAVRLSRRAFLRSTGVAGSGLLLGIALGSQHRFAAAQQQTFVYPPAAFVRIAPDDTVTVLVNKLEFGQGVFTSLPMLLAEELDCAWTKVRAEHAPAAQVYAHPSFGIQMTGGSDSIASSYNQLRVIGATARSMLLQAAAAQWSVAPDKLDTRDGVIYEIGGQKRRATYGSLATAAGKLPVPAKVGVKADPRDFKLIGKPTRRIDSREKVNGSAKFGLDQSLPDMRIAVVARPPVFGGKAASVDATKAKTVAGVEHVLPVPTDRDGNGVAVIAKGYWAAKQGRDALDIKWDLPAGPTTTEQLAQYRQLAAQPGTTAIRRGDDGAMKTAARKIAAEYEFPYLAHAPMEPLNAVVELGADKMTVWCGSQFQTVDQVRTAQAAGLTPEQVSIVTMFAGGGFGRRAVPTSDYLVEAVNVAVAMRKAGSNAPVKVIWSREDDIRGGYYRPAHIHRVEIGADGKGQPLAWQHTIVGQSILKGTPFEKFMVKDGVDATMVEGVVDTPYNLPNFNVSVHHPELNVPVLWWRSVGHSHTAFVMETLIDELAAAAKQDPITYRLALLDAKHTRQLAVLNLVRERSAWGKPLPAGRARGIALHESFNTVVAQVAEVSVADQQIRVHRVTAAVDCGLAVNPLSIEAQMQSAIAFGLSAAFHGRISLKGGQVEQSNFTDYPVLRMNEMPEVAVHIVPSTAKPTGMGEPGVPPIAPAVANAVAALNGKRLRKLPFDLASA